VHGVVGAAFPSEGQAAPVPVQLSTTSHSPAAPRQTTVEDSKPSVGHTVLAPVQVSSTSQKSAAPRQRVPELPAGCWQVSLLPLHWSRLQGLLSEEHGVPEGSFASTGQVGAVPVQFSAGSHSPFDDRHSVLVGSSASAGHTVLAPVQVSVVSQMPVPARHVAPALPAGCWQVSLVPLHWSRLQGLPSELQAVPFDFLASPGQAAPAPVQVSVRSHSPPFPRQTTDEGSKASGGHTVLEPVQLSVTSHTPAEARQVAPPLPGGCWQASFTPSH
jgi:hypothetical protein